jgi:FixJ family two-component response regulator
LLTGGCAVDDATCRILNGGGVGFIQKPYSEETLYRKIREIAG